MKPSDKIVRMSTSKRAKFFLRGIKDILNSKLHGDGFEYYHDQYWNDLPEIQKWENHGQGTFTYNVVESMLGNGRSINGGKV